MLEKGYYKIEEEYGLVIEGKRYKVDLAGFKGDMKVAVECNYSKAPSNTKLEDLQSYFGEVIELRVEDLVVWLQDKVERLETLLRGFKTELENQKNEVERLRSPKPDEQLKYDDRSVTSKVCGSPGNYSIHIPSTICDFLTLSEGDVLEYYTSDSELPQAKARLLITKKVKA